MRFLWSTTWDTTHRMEAKKNLREPQKVSVLFPVSPFNFPSVKKPKRKRTILYFQPGICWSVNEPRICASWSAACLGISVLPVLSFWFVPSCCTIGFFRHCLVYLHTDIRIQFCNNHQSHKEEESVTLKTTLTDILLKPWETHTSYQIRLGEAPLVAWFGHRVIQGHVSFSFWHPQVLGSKVNWNY